MRQAAVRKRLADEQLEDGQPAAIECMRRAREIDPPDTEFLFSNLAPRLISFKTGGILTGIIGILMFPWKLYADPSGYIFTWLIG